MSRPFSPRFPGSSGPAVRINGKIRAREVRVIGTDGKQLGVYALYDALTLARSSGVDLVEVAPTATPPVCRLVDYGKFRYEESKRKRDARKHQHATRVKEIQLTASIDPHDFGVKLDHAIEFLCDEMKVKVSLRFRGREMAHKEFGFQVVDKFLKALAVYGHEDAPPKLIGRGVTVMISPLPRNKRARHPREQEDASASAPPKPAAPFPAPEPPQPPPGRNPPPSGFNNNPFSQLDGSLGV